MKHISINLLYSSSHRVIVFGSFICENASRSLNSAGNSSRIISVSFDAALPVCSGCANSCSSAYSFVGIAIGIRKPAASCVKLLRHVSVSYLRSLMRYAPLLSGAAWRIHDLK